MSSLLKKHYNKWLLKLRPTTTFYLLDISKQKKLTTAQVDAYLNGSLSISMVQRLPHTIVGTPHQCNAFRERNLV
jgi:hypothetical protein